MAEHRASCNDASITFTINDITGNIVSFDAVAGKRGITVFLLADDTVTVKASIRIEPGQTINRNLNVNDRVASRIVQVTQLDQRVVTKRTFPHRIEWN